VDYYVLIVGRWTSVASTFVELSDQYNLRYTFSETNGLGPRPCFLCCSRFWQFISLQFLVPKAIGQYVVLFLNMSYIFLPLMCRPGRLTEPYFPSHPDRDIYVTLLGRTDPPTNDALLKSALVRRAMADVQRVLQIREDKPALQNLLQKGSVGEDIWNSLLAAERELEAEIMEVVAEANTFAEGWGSIIFQTANEMLANEKMRGLFEQTSELRREKGLWSLKLLQM
jgi:Preprotein translocase subunit Sec66